jgi:hypothetical protein
MYVIAAQSLTKLENLELIAADQALSALYATKFSRDLGL